MQRVNFQLCKATEVMYNFVVFWKIDFYIQYSTASNPFPLGLTPLGHAVVSQQLESLKLLVKMGASINAQDQLGRTGLSVAAYQVFPTSTPNTKYFIAIKITQILPNNISVSEKL